MREIYFRGRCCGGPWLQGSLLRYADGYCEICVPDGEEALEKFRVEPDTVGQFTGLTDKNGKKIFEGDILRFMAYGIEYTGKVEFLNGAFWVKCRFHDRIGAIIHGYKPEIIGNIHDNPELLGGAWNEGNS